MADAVRDLDFETAALIRDEIAALMGKTNGKKSKK
jgi:protein-arginine kinase activator protein McsA